MRAIRTLGMALLASMSALAEECAVAVVVRNPALADPAVLARAKTVAAGIFAGIGVELQWAGPATVDSGGCALRIEAELGTTAGAEERPASLAYVTVGVEADKRIHIFLDRVAAMVPRPAIGNLLGHVLAHEITHILEVVPRHSDGGVMKACWERKDLEGMAYHPLRFQLVDEALIHAGLTNQAIGAND